LNSPLPPFTPLYLAPINRLLRQNSWALPRLQPFAGKILRVDCFPVSLRLGIAESGEVAAAAPERAPDLTIRLTPGLMLRLAARDDTVWNDFAIEGDAHFAAALSAIARNLHWDVEEDLSRVFGDIAAHRMAKTARKLAQWGEQGADNLARAFTEYWTEERPLAAGRDDVEQFNREVDVLRDDLARLEKRIERRERVNESPRSLP
jgi:ubiquinone biosynthesis accessory factor UbiJ